MEKKVKYLNINIYMWVGQPEYRHIYVCRATNLGKRKTLNLELEDRIPTQSNIYLSALFLANLFL